MHDRIQRDLASLSEESAGQLKTIDETREALSRHTRRTSSMATTRNGGRTLKVLVAVGALLVGGAVFAATATDLFRVSVDTDGKTDQQVEEEIHDQLEREGVDSATVRFEREGDDSTLAIEGKRGEKQFKVVRKSIGGQEGTVVEVRPPSFDTEREPGMSDEELKAKIEKQLEALGVDGEVSVEGDKIRIEARKEVEVEAEGEGPGEHEDEDVEVRKVAR
jgi:hypothetical protein